MDKEEFKRLRQQLIDQEKQYYSENPDIGALVKTKRIIRRVVSIFWVLHSVLTLLVMLQMHTLTGFGVGLEIFKLLFQLLILNAVLSPEIGWRVHLLMYLYAAANHKIIAEQISKLARR